MGDDFGVDPDDEREEEEQDEADRQVVNDHAGLLLDRFGFDSVSIFVTRYNPKTRTTTAQSGERGNYYARVGAVRAWLTKQDEMARAETRRDFDRENF